MAPFLPVEPTGKKPGFPLQVLGFAYANPVGFPLQSLAHELVAQLRTQLCDQFMVSHGLFALRATGFSYRGAYSAAL
jgi:hypothetical protein